MAMKQIGETILEGLLLTRAQGRADHRLKTKDCPTIPQFERLAAPGARWTFQQMIHISNCRYCQSSIDLFRREMGIKPWWEQWSAQAQKVFTYLRGMELPSAYAAPLPAAIKTSLPPLCTVPAVVIREGQKQEDAAVEVMEANDTADECLSMKIRMKGPFFEGSQMPIELTLVAHPAGEPINSLLLPRLTGDAEEELRAPLAPEWLKTLKEWRAELLEKRREGKNVEKEFPVRFILRPGAGGIAE